MPLQPVEWIADELAEFGRCVREGTRPQAGGEAGTANGAVLQAIVESVTVGRLVLVER